MSDKKPIYKIRVGNISASIFENKVKKDKEEFKFLTVSLQRSYKKDDSSEWVNESINLRKEDLIKLEIVLNKIRDEVYIKNEKEE